MLTSVEWNNDPVLGNLKLNLTKANGTPYSTIVIAGENGTGKSTLSKVIMGISDYEIIDNSVVWVA